MKGASFLREGIQGTVMKMGLGIDVAPLIAPLRPSGAEALVGVPAAARYKPFTMPLFWQASPPARSAPTR